MRENFIYTNDIVLWEEEEVAKPNQTLTTIQSVMNTKLCQQRFRPLHEAHENNTYTTRVWVKSASLYCSLRLILIQWLIDSIGSQLLIQITLSHKFVNFRVQIACSMFMFQKRRRKRRRKPKVWIVLEFMRNAQTKSSAKSLVRSSQVLSRTNENFHIRVRFRFGTRTTYKPWSDLINLIKE